MLEKSFSASDLKKSLNGYCYKLAAAKGEESSEIISFIVTKKQQTTKARIKKFANLSWSVSIFSQINSKNGCLIIIFFAETLQ